MNDTTVITLSSDEDEAPKEPPAKKPKYSEIDSKPCETLVVLSDDETKNDQPAEETRSVNVFDNFLETCSKALKNEVHKELLLSKIPVARRMFGLAGDYVETDDFRKSLLSKLALVREKPEHILQCFNIIYQQLKFEIRSSRNANKGDDKRERLISRLEKTLKLLHAKIRNMEQQELSLDALDNEDSSYIQLQRYKSRAVEVYKKLCQLNNENCDMDRITQKRLRFDHSKHSIINKVISKKYRNNVFPSYADFDKFIRKTVDKHKLKISALDIKITRWFKILGDMLQKRRKQDLLDIHADYIESFQDPAEDDETLQNQLKANKEEANEKINNILTEFVIKQEKGEEPSVSSDSDDSVRESSASDADDINAKKDTVVIIDENNKNNDDE